MVSVEVSGSPSVEDVSQSSSFQSLLTISTSDSPAANEDLTWSWFFSQLISFRLIPALGSLTAIFMIVRYLRTIYGRMIKTHFQIYCIILSVSDLCISCSGVLTVTGVFKFIDSPILSTCESVILMFFGMNSLYTHMLIALDRAKSTLTTVVQKSTSKRPLISLPFFISTLTVAVLSSIAITIAPFILGRPKYEMSFGGYYWGMDYNDPDIRAKAYIWTMFIAGYAIPLALIVLIYAEILRRVYKQSQASASMIKTRKVTTVCAVASLAFIAGWTPYAYLAFRSFMGQSVGLAFAFFANAAAKLSCIWNSMMFFMSLQKDPNDKTKAKAKEAAAKKKEKEKAAKKRPVEDTTHGDDASSLEHSYSKTQPVGKKDDGIEMKKLNK